MPQPPTGRKPSPATAAAGFHDLAALRPGRSPKPKPKPEAGAAEPASSVTGPVRRRYAAGVTAIGIATAYILVARPRHLRWGASSQECNASLPGDDLIVTPDLTATRAITVRASADQVWPWIAQLGQGRAGFYSYDFLENLAGCDIHSADRIVPGWQEIKIGDEFKLRPGGGARRCGPRAGDRSFSAVGLRWRPLRLPMTSPGRAVLHDEPDRLAAAPA